MSHSSIQSIPTAAHPAESGNTASTKQKDGLSASAPAFVPRSVDTEGRQQQHGRGYQGPRGRPRQNGGVHTHSMHNRDRLQSQHHHSHRSRGHHRPQAAGQRVQPEQRQPGAELSNPPNHQHNVEPSSCDTTTSHAVGSSPDRVGSRGVSARGRAVAANHLLNFQYDSGRGLWGGRGGGRGAGGGRPSSGSHASNLSAARRHYQPPRPQRYDKQKFLQANFRFLVTSTLDRRQYESDADRMFDWDDVILVDMMSATPIQCPISLESPPICPQITPCGHVYSFGSIMQHLMNHGGEQLRRSAPCPLCYQPVVARELRLVQVRDVEPVPTVGSTVTFQLLRRPRSSIIPTAVKSATAEAADADTAVTAAPAPGLSPTSKWKSSAPSSKSSSSAGSPAAADAACIISTPLADNLFAKFATCSDPRPLWRASAQQLGQQLALIVSQGGTEAQIEAPAMFAAADALANRARRFAEHQAVQLQQQGVPGASIDASETPVGLNWPVWLKQDPRSAGVDAEQLVRDAFTLALDGSKAALVAKGHKQQVQQRLQQEFPELAAGTSPGTSVAARPSAVTPLSAAAGDDGRAGHSAGLPSPRVAQQPAQQGQEQQRQHSLPLSDGDADDQTATELHFDHAFSEDEEEDRAEQQKQKRDDDATAGNTAAAPAAADDEESSDAPSVKLGSRVELPPVYGSSPGSSHILGSSPNSHQLTAASQSGDFYMYQSADGQWVFLHPLNLRCLLHAYGSYEACPPHVTGQVLEIDDLLQDEASRRRWKFLSHLPLNGTFRLAEVQLLTPALTPQQLTPFAEELSAREKRRKRRADEAARESRREAAAAAAAQKARQGPTAAELRAMPKLGFDQGPLGTTDGASEAIDVSGLTPEQVDEALAAQVMHDSAALTGASPPSGGVSFAKMTKLGFAASGPALGAAASPGGLSEDGLGPTPAVAATPAALRGAWGAKSSVGQSAAARLGGQASSSAPKSAWGAGSSSSTSAGSGSSAPRQAGLVVKSSWAGGGALVRNKAASGSTEDASSSASGAANWLVLGSGAAGVPEALAGTEGDPAVAGGESPVVVGPTAGSKKGKKEKKMMFTTAAQRRY